MTETHHHHQADGPGAIHGHAPSCACGHDHAHAADAAPRMSAPASLIASGSLVRLGFAALAILALWAVTWWALGA